MATIWPFRIEWSRGVSESLEWNTAILMSPIGAEQRFANRTAPRRYFEYRFTLTREDRSYFDLLMQNGMAEEWLIPVAADGVSMPPSAILEAGDTRIRDINTRYKEFKLDGLMLLRGDGKRLSEVVTIDVVEDETIYIKGDTGLAFNYPQGAKVYPCIRARIVDQNVEVSKRSDQVFTGSVRFLSLEVNDPPIARYTNYEVTTSYRGFPVFAIPPNEVRDIGHAYERMLQEIDNTVALPHRSDTANRTFTMQTHDWFLVGREQRAAFRQMLYDLQGRLHAVWVPTWASDLKMVDVALAGDLGLTVADAGLSTLPRIPFGREHIAVQLRDGRTLYREVKEAIPFTATSERVLLDRSIGPLHPRDVLRISFMPLKRLGQDMIEISHRSDADGVAECSLLLRDAPDLRRTSSPPKSGDPLPSPPVRLTGRKPDLIDGKYRRYAGPNSEEVDRFIPQDFFLVNPTFPSRVFNKFVISLWIKFPVKGQGELYFGLITDSNYPQLEPNGNQFTFRNYHLQLYLEQDRQSEADIFMETGVTDPVPSGSFTTTGKAFNDDQSGYFTELPSVAGRTVNVLVSADTTSGIVQVYVDDKPCRTPYAQSMGLNREISLPDASSTSETSFLLSASPNEFFPDEVTSIPKQLCFGDVFFTTGTEFFNLDDEKNRRKFVTRRGDAVDMGERGERPFGVPPVIYQSYRKPGPVFDFTQNKGTAGNFVQLNPEFLGFEACPVKQEL